MAEAAPRPRARLLGTATAGDVLRGLPPRLDRDGYHRSFEESSLLARLIAGPLILALSPDREEAVAAAHAALEATRALTLEPPGSPLFVAAKQARDRQQQRERATGTDLLAWRLDPAFDQNLGWIGDVWLQNGHHADLLAARTAVAAERSRLASEDARSPATDAETREAGF